MTSTKRAHIVLPEELVQEIDKIAGSRGRSAFLADLAKREIKRQQLIEIFKSKEAIWKDEDHPELKDGASAWVRKTRALDEIRFEKIREQRNRE
jgi:hypothetical protein